MKRHKKRKESQEVADIGTARLLLRSFFLQSSWNIERMQNLGFLYALLPALERIYGHDADRFHDACKRHLELFNTHPYMAAPIIGAVIQMEAQRNQGVLPLETIRDFKRGAMIAFAAMGDSLFWKTLRPLCGALAILMALEGFFWAPLVFVITYNTAHLFVRGYGLHSARQNGIRVIEQIHRWDIPKRVAQLRHFFPIVLGALTAKCALIAPGELESTMPWLALPLVIIVCIVIRRRWSIPIVLGSIFVLLSVGMLLFFPE
ncbi:MAG: PTS system mannose/fructose/sorbose family transporter subunit IID [Deltaproteobacteria bacterium]|nr:PTS system mannose/fructose/sorbose family transporter subunit IID [Deltaproteobacteria bacterium]